MYAGGGPGPLRSAFHPQFQILIPAFDGRTGQINDVRWIQPGPKQHAEPKAAAPNRSFEVSVLDITGKVAVCKVQAVRDGRLEYTDYVTLTKINQDWKVVSKVFHRHGSLA